MRKDLPGYEAIRNQRAWLIGVASGIVVFAVGIAFLVTGVEWDWLFIILGAFNTVLAFINWWRG